MSRRREVRGEPAGAVLQPVDPLTRATVALCGGLVVATPLFFAAALLCAALGVRFAGELWLLGLWALATGALALVRRALVAVSLALCAAGVACLGAVLARLVLASGASLDPATASVNAGFAVAGVLGLAAGALVRRGPGRLWSA